MTIDIQYLKMPSSETLDNIIIKKLNKLSNKYSWLIRADVLIKTENYKGVVNKCCDIELSCPGPKIFAKSIEDDYEKAVVNTINDLTRQLKKRKQQFSKF
ncbi:HPF/RaiA family ribosome-associated protein [uncultured Croceitalea sp.]|uniref:HPF/RaiA family ribosome-associated protein n=1 Tax=uncultured Croceitalea sp. TaxID=1798908 RepID=UPI0033068E2C